uniref:Uncharacterized protein n=1 Tax=Arundo donax TaxID=35708 RepID=A0A0A8ZZ84_ARUDO
MLWSLAHNLARLKSEIFGLKL